MQLISDWLIMVAMATTEKIRLHYSMRNLILHNIWKFHENTCTYHKVIWVELGAYFTHKSMGKFIVNVYYPLALNTSSGQVALMRAGCPQSHMGSFVYRDRRFFIKKADISRLYTLFSTPLWYVYRHHQTVGDRFYDSRKSKFNFKNTVEWFTSCNNSPTPSSKSI